MDKFQTLDTLHEQPWWQISHLAHAQLYMAGALANNMSTPWGKYICLR